MGLPTVGAIAEVQNLAGFNQAIRQVNAGLSSAGSASQGLAAASSATGAAMSTLAGVGMAAVTAAAAAVTAAVGATAIAFGKVASEGLKMNANLEQLQIRLQTVTGRGEEMLQWVRDISTETPFTTETLADALAQAKAYGFTTEEAQRLVMVLGDLDAAMAGGGQVMASVNRALGQMQARTTVAASEMLQLTEAGVPAWQILADAMGTTVPELQDMVTKGLVPADDAIKAITETLERDFGGAMLDQSRTAKGMWESIKETASLIAADITKPLFETFKGVLQDVQGLLDNPAIQQGIENITNALRGFLESEAVVGTIQRIQNVLLGLIRGDITLGELIPPEIMKIAKQLAPIFSQIGQTLKGIDTTGLREGLSKFAQDMGTLISSEIIPFLIEEFQKFADWLSANAPLIEEVLGIIGEKFSELGPIISDAWSVIGPILSTLIQGILGLVTVLMEIVTGDWDAAWRQFLATVIQAGLNLSGALSNFADIIAQALGAESFAAVLEVWAGNWEAIRLILFTVWENIKTTILQAFVIILAFLLEQFAEIEAIWEKWTIFRDRVVDVFNGIVLAITGAMATAFETVSGRITDIIVHIQTRKAEFIEQGKQMIEGFIKGILSRADRLVAVVVELMANARQAALDVLGIGSPSKVFAAMGENVDTSFANAIQRFSGAPIAAAAAMAGGSAIAANQAVSAIPPASPVTVQGGNTDNSRVFAPVISTQTAPESPTSIVDELVLLQMLESA